MQRITLFVLLLAFGPALTINVEDLKEQAFEACKTPQEQVPEKYRAFDMKVCKCTAELTDFETVKAGDKEKIHKDWLNNTEICAQKLGATTIQTHGASE